MENHAYRTTVRLYNIDGKFVCESPLYHKELGFAVTDAHMCLKANYEGGELRVINPLKTNISVRDMKTGRFVKWSR